MFLNLESLSDHPELLRLVKGNEEFSKTQKEWNRGAPDLLNPFCAILSCADARVPPELILGQGIGDLFVTRVAGNVVTPATEETLRIAIEQLKVPLVLVMGHQFCRAVARVVQGELKQDVIARAIRRAVGKERDIKKAIIRNVLYQTEQLRRIFGHTTVQVVPAYYDMDHSKLLIIQEQSDQSLLGECDFKQAIPFLFPHGTSCSGQC